MSEENNDQRRDQRNQLLNQRRHLNTMTMEARLMTAEQYQHLAELMADNTRQRQRDAKLDRAAAKIDGSKAATDRAPRQPASGYGR